MRPIGAALGLSDMGYAALAEISAELANQVRALAVNPMQISGGSLKSRI
ncbi:MAG: hypothetical protein QNJ46_04700 [Leptolyngbyaceae cyanobacterium MO_188.B28]|nr:hypothetical protein [Leptolyngbyaceae cyanobacterium MO_188.B28]